MRNANNSYYRLVGERGGDLLKTWWKTCLTVSSHSLWKNAKPTGLRSSAWSVKKSTVRCDLSSSSVLQQSHNNWTINNTSSSTPSTKCLFTTD